MSKNVSTLTLAQQIQIFNQKKCHKPNRFDFHWLSTNMSNFSLDCQLISLKLFFMVFEVGFQMPSSHFLY